MAAIRLSMMLMIVDDADGACIDNAEDAGDAHVDDARCCH